MIALQITLQLRRPRRQAIHNNLLPTAPTTAATATTTTATKSLRIFIVRMTEFILLNFL
jgi:hypothetical protein